MEHVAFLLAHGLPPVFMMIDTCITLSRVVSGAQPGANILPGEPQESAAAENGQLAAIAATGIIRAFVDPGNRHLQARGQLSRRQNVAWLKTGRCIRGFGRRSHLLFQVARALRRVRLAQFERHGHTYLCEPVNQLRHRPSDPRFRVFEENLHLA